MSSTFKDIASSLVTSGYKWLTNTLYTAQQQLNVRPYLTAKIVDDTIQPNAQLFNGSGLPLGQGSMATAPDGKVFACGLDGSNNLAVWSDINLHSSAGVWANKTILDTSSSANFADSRNVFSIAISDYIGGSYHIDIFYFYNFANDGTALKIHRQSSDNGGLTWANADYCTSLGYLNNSLGNVSLAAFKPYLTSGGTVKSDCFFIQTNTGTFSSGFTGYDVYYGVNAVIWAQDDVNSEDWTIHSIGAFYINGKQYCIVSGFRNILERAVNANYSLWVTSLDTNTGSVSTDLWSAPVPILPIGSASTLNLNSFTYPSGTVANGVVYVTTKATLVDSVTQTATGISSTVVTTHTNYIIIQSDDVSAFSYPSILNFSNGTEFNSGSYASFVPQGSYWYLGGALGYLWEFIQNNITADVSSDVLSYSISEQAGQPSALNLIIGNQNNKWVGTSPTGTGAAAILGNRKVYLSQGYYNASGVPESVPKDIYYIDDIQQQVNSTNNDLVILGRDWYKKIKTTITKFTYGFIGPYLYSDTFDGTTNSNWNPIVGTWVFHATTNTLETTSNTSTMAFNQQTTTTYGGLSSIYFLNTQQGTIYVYGLYIDSDNYFRVEINTFAGTWAVVKRAAGSSVTMDNGSISLTNLNYYGVFIRRYGYYKFNVMVSTGGGGGNEIGNYSPSGTSVLLKNSGSGEYDLTTTITSTTSMQLPFTFAIGNINGGQSFRFFQRSVYNNRTNISVIISTIARISGIFSFKLSNTFRELLYLPNLSGTFSILNRILTIAAGNTALSRSNSYSNGEVQFKAKIVVANNSNPAGFRFIFRSDSFTTPTAAYYFHIQQISTGFNNPPVLCRFERLYSATTYQFFNSSYDVVTGAISTSTANTRLDLTKYNLFRIVVIDGQMSAYINDTMIAQWIDNNITVAALTSGYWGFSADTNTTVSVKDIKSPDFWKPVQTFSFNPGDDAEGALDSLISSLRLWIFSDLLGRFKAIFLNTTDTSTYTYNTQLSQQNVDSSDKEYVTQITVYGNNVVATARNLTVNPGFPTRDAVIVDYSITTYQDAQTRANNEMIDANQYRSQYIPKQIINPGAEIFDAITVVNTGNNTSGVNATSRTYSQKIVQGSGGHDASCNIELDTGNL